MTNFNPSISRIVEIESLIQNLTGLVSSFNNPARIPIPTKDGIDLISTKDIVRIEAERSYCFVHLTDSRRILVSKPLKDLESKLPTDKFYRVHSAHLVNMDYIDRYIKSDGGSIVLNDGQHIPLSRRRKKEFVQMVMQLAS